jgi:hypothetical protein
MKKFIYPALLSNAATLGVQWIYNVKYLEDLSKKQSILFLVQNKQRFDEASPSYFAYPDTILGDLSVQGEILKWLYKALSLNKNFNQNDYKELLLSKFMPGGQYKGYVETYAKKLVALHLLDQLNVSVNQITLNDNQLVGFVPYIIAKELELSLDTAFRLASLFTQQTYYQSFYEMFDSILDHLKEKDLKDAIKSALNLGPIDYKTSLHQAIEMTDTNKFIDEYAGRACSVSDALPVIIHVLYHSHSFETALELNAKIGGASADRALLIGTILSQVYDIPNTWTKHIPLAIYNT